MQSRYDKFSMEKHAVLGTNTSWKTTGAKLSRIMFSFGSGTSPLN